MHTFRTGGACFLQRTDRMDTAMSDGAAASRCLREHVRGLAPDVLERRHEALMSWAETLGLERGWAEKVTLLAEDVDLEPAYALLLVRCGVGVRELEPPAEPDEDAAAQPTPPAWVEADAAGLDDVALERRLRTTFRRFRSHLGSSGTPAAAADAFLAEPDVAPLVMRQEPGRRPTA